MSEIRVQEKRGMGAWPWIIGLVVVGLVVWLIAGMNDGEDEVASEMGETTEVVAPAPAMEDMSAEGAVDEYLMFVRDTDAAGTAEGGHEFAIEGVEKLTAAMESVADDDAYAGDTGIEARMTEVDESVARLVAEGDPARHSEMIQQSFLSIAAAFGALDGTGEAADLRQAAEAIDPQTALLEQTMKVEAFFDAAANRLERLAVS